MCCSGALLSQGHAGINTCFHEFPEPLVLYGRLGVATSFHRYVFSIQVSGNVSPSFQYANCIIQVLIGFLTFSSQDLPPEDLTKMPPTNKGEDSSGALSYTVAPAALLPAPPSDKTNTANTLTKPAVSIRNVSTGKPLVLHQSLTSERPAMKSNLPQQKNQSGAAKGKPVPLGQFMKESNPECQPRRQQWPDPVQRSSSSITTDKSRESGTTAGSGVSWRSQVSLGDWVEVRKLAEGSRSCKAQGFIAEVCPDIPSVCPDIWVFGS